MAVFRVERNRGYTVMSNHHLRNKELTLKAKGLLSQMLSLPEDWDYTLAGLSHINRESIDAIRTAVWELEKAGYITRRQGRDEKGKMTAIEYTIYEQPQPPLSDNPALENPTTGKPILENPTTDKPTTENPTQLNKEIQRTDLPTKEKIMTDEQSTHSIPIHSPNPSPYDGNAKKEPERKRKEASTQSAVEIYREIIKDNIDYDILILDNGMEKERMVWSATLGLPLSLENVGAVLGLEKQKLTEGKELLRYFCVPCKPTKANGGRTRNLPEHDREKWERFKAYNLRDVEAEMSPSTRRNTRRGMTGWQSGLTGRKQGWMKWAMPLQRSRRKGNR